MDVASKVLILIYVMPLNFLSYLLKIRCVAELGIGSFLQPSNFRVCFVYFLISFLESGPVQSAPNTKVNSKIIKKDNLSYCIYKT